MDSSQPYSREHQRKVIDAEIQSLEESIRALKHRRNALAPISSLPTEIITTIFSLLQVMVSAYTPGKMPDPLALRSVSHVCHRWREIALNQPLFWSHVNFAALSSAGASEVIARAKTVPLYVEARLLGSHWDDVRYSAFQDELQMCVSRTRHLHISAKSWHLRKILDRLESPAPSLEILSLSSERSSIHPDVPDTLFVGATPRLSFLRLRHCDISWKSPLLKGLRMLEMRLSGSMTVIPSLSVWLDALEEMPQLKMLTLHEASPIPSSFPFDVERTVTLPSLTHLDISDSPRVCAFALSHLKLPALICLCIQTISIFNGDDVGEVLPYVTGHALTQPLQSMLIQCKYMQINILGWPIPDIDAEVHEPPTLPSATPPAPVAFSITCNDDFNNHLEFLGTLMAAFSLDSLVTLIAEDFVPPPFEQFWYRNSLKWPLLQRVRLTPVVASLFMDWLLADKGGCENPLLPSLKELALVGAELDEHLKFRLYDALEQRAEQGVPLEMLDLRTCLSDPANPGAVQLLSDYVADVLGPEETFDARAQIRSMWGRFNRGPFTKDVNYVQVYGEANQMESDDDDDYSLADTGGDNEESIDDDGEVEDY